MVGYQHFQRFAVQMHLSPMARASKFWRNLRRWLKMCGPKFAMENIEILAQAKRRGPREASRARGAGRQGRRHTQASRVRKGAQSRAGGGCRGGEKTQAGRARTQRLSSQIFDTVSTEVSAPIPPRRAPPAPRQLAAQPLELRTETFPNCDLTCTCECVNIRAR